MASTKFSRSGDPYSAWAALEEGDRRYVRAQVDGALARRGEDFLRGRRALWIQWLSTGCIGLAGLLFLGWSASQAVLLMLAAFWIGWIEDLVVWCLRRQGLAISVQHAADDGRFWQLLAILRKRRKQAPDSGGHPPPALGLIVDATAGVVASALIVSGLEREGGALQAALAAPALVPAILVMLVAGTLPSLRTRLMVRGNGSTPLPAFAAGQRGIGLLVLVFGVIALGGGRLAPSVLVGGAYGFGILMASIELAWGIASLRDDARWAAALRDAIR